ncbi:MAG: ECF transporter S component [Ruminococcus sp.]|nr:ECF transporter S component [Ruminococcus sp.]
MNNEITTKRFNTKKMTVLAMFVALSYLCVFVFRFKVQFLSFEMSDIFITICGFAFGPISAVGVALAKSLLEMITIADTGIYGAVMNFASSAAFAGTAAIIYKYKKSLGGALLAMLGAIITRTVVIIALNILIIPLYMKCSREVVIGMISSLLLPFNLVKAFMNAGLVFILYKPLAGALRNIGVLPAHEENFALTKKNIFVMIISALVVIGAIVALVVCLNGNIEWVRK